MILNSGEEAKAEQTSPPFSHYPLILKQCSGSGPAAPPCSLPSPSEGGEGGEGSGLRPGFQHVAGWRHQPVDYEGVGVGQGIQFSSKQVMKSQEILENSEKYELVDSVGSEEDLKLVDADFSG